MPQFVVCPECAGTGRDASTAYVITSDHLDEYVGGDYEDSMDYVREVAGLTEPCPCCRGMRVTTPAKAKEWEDEAYERGLMEQEAYWERRAGC